MERHARDVRERQRAEWAAVAPGWRRNREKMSAPTSTITETMVTLAGIRPGQRVLDLACGVGDPAFTIAGLVGPEGCVLGLDLSPEMVEAARGISRNQGVENAFFREIPDELDLGVPAGGFDVATCRLGLMFFPDPAAAVRELRAALKPGGRVVACTWGAPKRNPNFTLPMEIIARHADPAPADPEAPGLFALPTPEKLGAVLDDAGLVDVRTQLLRTPVVKAKDAASYWHGITTIAGPLVSVLNSLPEEQRRAIREDAIRTVGGMFPEGPVELDGEAVIAVGTKPL